MQRKLFADAVFAGARDGLRGQHAVARLRLLERQRIDRRHRIDAAGGDEQEVGLGLPGKLQAVEAAGQIGVDQIFRANRRSRPEPKAPPSTPESGPARAGWPPDPPASARRRARTAHLPPSAWADSFRNRGGAGCRTRSPSYPGWARRMAIARVEPTNPAPPVIRTCFMH